MNKQVLVRDVARDLGKSQQEVSLVVNALFARLATAILDGERITISSFGTFTPKDRPEHNGYDPQGFDEDSCVQDGSFYRLFGAATPYP